jgi:hypothetical protein
LKARGLAGLAFLTRNRLGLVRAPRFIQRGVTPLRFLACAINLPKKALFCGGPALQQALAFRALGSDLVIESAPIGITLLHRERQTLSAGLQVLALA